jgi:hypothetical protein
MTNREQIAWAISFSEYEDKEVADQICGMIDAVGGNTFCLKESLEKWLGLECEPDTNNCGELEEKDRADYFWEDEE